ncbi:MAG: C2H2-type zinc finger protein [Terriglobales bacterium]
MSTATAITPYSTQANYLAGVTATVTAEITAAHEKFSTGEKAFAQDYGISYGKVLFHARKKLADAGYGQLSNLLDKLSIARSTAYFWIEKYEISIGVKKLPAIPCEHCEQTFPSKTQLKKHVRREHPETFTTALSKITSPAPSDKDFPPLSDELAKVVIERYGGSGRLVTDFQGRVVGVDSQNRGHGMAMTRWRGVAESLGYKLKVVSGNFILSKDGKEIDLGFEERGLREFLRTKQQATPKSIKAMAEFLGVTPAFARRCIRVAKVFNECKISTVIQLQELIMTLDSVQVDAVLKYAIKLKTKSPTLNSVSGTKEG